jgi:hypothetical protein
MTYIGFVIVYTEGNSKIQHVDGETAKHNLNV